jgi:hypothetical protein
VKNGKASAQHGCDRQHVNPLDGWNDSRPTDYSGGSDQAEDHEIYLIPVCMFLWLMADLTNYGGRLR